MPVPIPNKIHFIWLGSALRAGEIRNMLKWAFENPEYQVQLWAEQKRMYDYAEKIQEEIDLMDLGPTGTEPEDDEEEQQPSGQGGGDEEESGGTGGGGDEDDQQGGDEDTTGQGQDDEDGSGQGDESSDDDEKGDDEEEDDEADNDENNTEEISIPFNAMGKDVVLLIKPINIVPALAVHGMFYEELHEWKNFGAASDILRIWVLHFEGGIYMDFDTFSNNTPLPLDIIAPFDILFAHLELMPVPCNALIAAPQHAEPLMDIAREMEARYISRHSELTAPLRQKPVEYVSVGNGLGLQVTADAHKRMQRIETARERIQSCTTSTDPLHQDNRVELFHSMMHQTCWRTGPYLMQDYMEAQVGNLLAKNENAPRNLYFFQIITGYNVHLEAHSSWLK